MSFFAHLSMSSKNLRDFFATAWGAGMAITLPPPLMIFAKIPKPVLDSSLKKSVTSESSIGMRRSGLSDPYLAMASA